MCLDPDLELSGRRVRGEKEISMGLGSCEQRSTQRKQSGILFSAETRNETVWALSWPGPGIDSVKGGKTYFISQFQKVHHEGGQIQRERLTHGDQRKQMPAWPGFTFPLLFHKEPSP